MMEKHRFLGIALLMLSGAPVVLKSDLARPFDYREFWDSGTKDESDRSNELRACVELWAGYRDIRAKLFRNLSAAGFDRRVHSILLEAGGSGFGSYGYVAVIDGTVLDIVALEGSKAPTGRTRTIERLVSSITDDRVAHMQGSISPSMADGPCYFLTITMSAGKVAQVAVYGEPSESTFAGKVIETLLPYVRDMTPREPDRK